MIMITHDMYLITEYTDRTLVFADGKIVADESPFEILENENFVKMGNLRQPSLYQLARKADISPISLTKAFINFQNQERLKHE